MTYRKKHRDIVVRIALCAMLACFALNLAKGIANGSRVDFMAATQDAIIAILIVHTEWISTMQTQLRRERERVDAKLDTVRRALATCAAEQLDIRSQIAAAPTERVEGRPAAETAAMPKSYVGKHAGVKARRSRDMGQAGH